MKTEYLTLEKPITETTFIDLIEKEGNSRFELLKDIFFIGTEKGGLTQIYCLPDLEI